MERGILSKAGLGYRGNNDNLVRFIHGLDKLSSAHSKDPIFYCIIFAGAPRSSRPNSCSGFYSLLRTIFILIGILLFAPDIKAVMVCRCFFQDDRLVFALVKTIQPLGSC